MNNNIALGARTNGLNNLGNPDNLGMRRRKKGND
jgi:hypothetical protein